MLFRGVICCSGGLYGCSGKLNTVQGGYMLFRWVICCSGELYGCSGGLYVEENNDVLVATNVVASRPPADWNADRWCQFWQIGQLN